MVFYLYTTFLLRYPTQQRGIQCVAQGHAVHVPGKFINMWPLQVLFLWIPFAVFEQNEAVFSIFSYVFMISNAKFSDETSEIQTTFKSLVVKYLGDPYKY